MAEHRGESLPWLNGGCTELGNGPGGDGRDVTLIAT